MNILIDISHPGQVHLFKNIYFALKDRHNVVWSTRDIPIAIRLLDNYGIPYINLGRKRISIFGKILSILLFDFKLFLLVKKHKINVGLTSGISLPHVSLFTKMKSIVFDDDDDEAQPFAVKFGHPYADAILSPRAITRKAKNTIYYRGIHELFYLHHNHFKPDERVLENLNFNKNEKYFVLRFVAFNGHHDIGEKGLAIDQKIKLINLLKPHGRVFITSEKPIEKEFEDLRIPILPHQMHSFLFFSELFIGDSQTMISEASIMGVPSIKCNTFAGRLSVPNELENTYGLCYSYHPNDFDLFIEKINDLLKRSDLRQDWGRKKNVFINDHIDPVDFAVNFIENYSGSDSISKIV
jgi:predicted glycosyltransferase